MGAGWKRGFTTIVKDKMKKIILLIILTLFPSFVFADGAVVPRTNSTSSVGTAAKNFAGGYFDNITADTVTSTSNTAGNLFIADGTNFKPIAMSGDITITSAGVTAVGADKVALTTDTTGSYAAGDAEAGNATGLACTDCVAAGEVDFVNSATATAGNILIADGTDFESKAMSGDCTITSAGEIDCPSGAGATSLTGLSDVGSATITAGRVLIADGTKFQSVGISGSVVLTSAGATTLAANTVGASQITDNSITIDEMGDDSIDSSNVLNNTLTTDDLGANSVASSELASTTVTAGTFLAANITVDGDGRINFAARGQLTSLSDVTSSTPTAGNLLVADGTDWNSVAMSGDCTITSAGAIDCPSAVGATSLTGLSDVGSATITAGRILVADGTKFQSAQLTGDCAIDGSGVIECPNTSGWDDSTTNVSLQTITDEVIIGAATPVSSSKLSIVGDTDQIQVTIQGNATQTNNLLVLETSAGTDVMSVDTVSAAMTGNFTVSKQFGLPSGASPQINAFGNLGIDTTTGQLLFMSNDSVKAIPYQQTKCAYVEDLVAADDNKSLGAFDNPVTIDRVGCTYSGTGTTTATITLEDGGGNAMTIAGTNPSCTTEANGVGWAQVSGANAILTRGEIVRFDVTNTPSPTTDDYTICVSYTFDRQ